MSQYTFTYVNGQIDDACECEWLYDCGGRYRETEPCDYCSGKPWAKERSMIRSFLLQIDYDISHLEPMFEYILTIGPFLVACPRERDALITLLRPYHTTSCERVLSFLAHLV